MGAAHSLNKPKPIVFSAPMMLALLAGRKTQTRRLVDRALRHEGWTDYAYFGPSENNPSERSKIIECGPDYPDDHSDQIISPFGSPRDRLWVREGLRQGTDGVWEYAADQAALMNGLLGDEDRLVLARKWHHQRSGSGRSYVTGRFMPKWACRIWLELTDVRCERLQLISPEDAMAEGFAKLSKDQGQTWKYGIPDLDGEPGHDDRYGWAWREWCQSPVVAYERLWGQLHGAESWKANPHVWVYTFERIKPFYADRL